MEKIKHPSFPDYWVHENGSVTRAIKSSRGNAAGETIHGGIGPSGYRRMKLVDVHGVRRMVRTNRLVCEAFYGLAPSLEHHAAHKNGNRLDNRIENLYWATPKENKRDSIKHGTAVSGKRVRNQHGDAKLTEDAVIQIKQAYCSKRGDIINLARAHGVGTTTIYNVVTGKTWKHVALPGRSVLDRKRETS